MRAEREDAVTIRTQAFEQFIADLDRITAVETSAEAITAKIAPLLGALVRDPEAVPARFRQRPADGGRGRYMLHRAPRFNVTSVVWGPGETAKAHNHETWGAIGVIDNEIEETRYRLVPGAQPDGRARLEVRTVLRHGPGAVSCLTPGDEIHAMHNPTARDTVEIHVYGRDLAGLRRKTWEADGTEKALISPKYLNC
jgi:predicted metal-dependent enzyme (double-stranded beta helix superfamily)